MGFGAHPLLPKEHGAWAVLLVPPLVVGALRGFTPDLALVIAVSLAFFTGHPAAQVLFRHARGSRQPAPLVDAARRRCAVCAAAATAAGLPLLAAGHWHLLAFLPPAAAAFIGSHALSRARGKTPLSDFVAMAGLTLTGPAALAVADGGCGPDCILFYLYNLLFFGGSVFYVHMKMRRPGGRENFSGAAARLTAGRANLLYQAGTLTGLGGLAVADAAPPAAFLAFVPMALQAVCGTCTLGAPVRFKRLGFLLLGHSILFGVLLGASLS
jgi:hypothetical protein